jgi:hypothetical protein
MTLAYLPTPVNVHIYIYAYQETNVELLSYIYTNRLMLKLYIYIYIYMIYVCISVPMCWTGLILQVRCPEVYSQKIHCFPFPSAIVLVQMTTYSETLRLGKSQRYILCSLHQAVARNADIVLPQGRWIGNSWWTGTAQTQGTTPILELFLFLLRLGYIGRSWYLAMV